jgi:hypothetical protein
VVSIEFFSGRHSQAPVGRTSKRREASGRASETQRARTILRQVLFLISKMAKLLQPFARLHVA